MKVYWSCFKGITWGTPDIQGGVRMGFIECVNTMLTWTELKLYNERVRANGLSKTILQGTLDNLATPWSAEKVLDGQRRRVHPCLCQNCSRWPSAEKNKLAEDLYCIIPHVPPTTQSVRGLNRTEEQTDWSTDWQFTDTWGGLLCSVAYVEIPNGCSTICGVTLRPFLHAGTWTCRWAAWSARWTRVTADCPMTTRSVVTWPSNETWSVASAKCLPVRHFLFCLLLFVYFVCLKCSLNISLPEMTSSFCVCMCDFVYWAWCYFLANCIMITVST